jgi:DNA-binding HxlR family transcriptional regulator
MPDAPRERSALEEAVSAVGDKWALLLVDALLDGPRRFKELLEEVPGIAPNILSARLKRMEGDGVIVAHAYSERPPRFAYELTATGHELAGALRLLADWGAQHGGAEPPRHDPCGTPMEARWFCPTCGVALGEDEDPDLHHV